MSNNKWGVAAAICVLGLGGCAGAATDELDAESLGSDQQAIAFGLQGFARFDSAGNHSSVASTVGASINAVHDSLGQYTVTFRALAAFVPSAPGQGGTVQVVAIGGNNVRCTLGSNWTYTATHDVVANVVCRKPGVGLADSGFSAYFGRGPTSSGKAAYARVNADGSVPSATSWSSDGAPITATHIGPGAYWVSIHTEHRQQVQVTALSRTNHCHASLRELGITTVVCYDDAGVLTDTKFTINQAGTDGIGLGGKGAFAQVDSDGALPIFYHFNSCPLGSTSSSRIGVGRYVVSHTLVGESLGNYQVSGYGTFSGYCKLHKIGSPFGGSTASVTVQCYDAAGLAKDMRFVESYTTFINDCGP